MGRPLIFKSLGESQLTAVLQKGAVGVLPTDTVYGLVCRAADEQAVTRLYRLKKRDKKPGTVIAHSIEQLVGLGIKRRYLKAVESYWPNPISVEIPHSIGSLHQGTGRQAFRIPNNTVLQDLLIKVGPLLTTSANAPGQPPANTIAEAQKYFGEKIDFYVDGGDLSGRLPSTLIRVVDDAVEVLRQGAGKIET